MTPNIHWDGEKAKLKFKDDKGVEVVHEIPVLSGKFQFKIEQILGSMGEKHLDIRNLYP